MARVSVATADGTSVASFTQLNAIWGPLQVTGGVFNCASSNTNNEAAALWSGAGSFTDDQYAEIAIGGLSFLSVDFQIGVICRASTDTGAARDYYFAYVAADSSGPTYTTVLGKYVNGTRTVLNSSAATWANGDLISLETEGTTLRLCKNGTPLGGAFTQTDTSLTTGKPGIMANGTAPTGDNWVGGNITASGAQNLAGAATGQGTGAATAAVTKPLAAGATGQGSDTGTLAHTVPLGGGAQGQAGATGSLLGGATITMPPGDTGSASAWASHNFPLLVALRVSDGQAICSWANQVANGAGVLSLFHNSLVSGVNYAIVGWEPDGSGGYWAGIYIAAAA